MPAVFDAARRQRGHAVRQLARRARSEGAAALARRAPPCPAACHAPLRSGRSRPFLRRFSTGPVRSPRSSRRSAARRWTCWAGPTGLRRSIRIELRRPHRRAACAPWVSGAPHSLSRDALCGDRPQRHAAAPARRAPGHWPPSRSIPTARRSSASEQRREGLVEAAAQGIAVIGDVWLDLLLCMGAPDGRDEQRRHCRKEIALPVSETKEHPDGKRHDHSPRRSRARASITPMSKAAPHIGRLTWVETRRRAGGGAYAGAARDRRARGRGQASRCADRRRAGAGFQGGARMQLCRSSF